MNEPVRWIKVADILAKAVGSSDFGTFPNDEDGRARFWLKIIYSKASDSGFGRLVDSMLERGFDVRAPIGWDGEYINEGHHRLVAAILLCMNEIPVTPYGRDTGEICAHNGCCSSYGDNSILL